MTTCRPACCQDRAGPQHPSDLAKGSVMSVRDPHAPGVAFCPVLSGLCTALCICQSSFVSISLFEFHGTPVSCHYLHLSGRNEAQESETQSLMEARSLASWLCSWGPFCHPGPVHPSMSTPHPSSCKKPLWTKAPGLSPLLDQRKLTASLSCLVIQSLSCLLNFSGVHIYPSQENYKQGVWHEFYYTCSLSPLPQQNPIKNVGDI